MSKYYLGRPERYTSISNAFLLRRDLSIEAKGLLCQIMALAKDFEFRESYFYDQEIKDGTTINRCKTVKKALKELEDNGFLYRTMVRGNDGKYLAGFWYADTEPVQPPDIARSMSDFFDEKIVLKTMLKSFPDNELEIVDEYPNELEKWKIYIKRDLRKKTFKTVTSRPTLILPSPDEEVQPEEFWDFIARMSRADNAKAYANKLRSLHRVGKFDAYDGWVERYHDFIELALGGLDPVRMSTARKMFLNKYIPEITEIRMKYGSGGTFAVKTKEGLMDFGRFLMESEVDVAGQFFREVRAGAFLNKILVNQEQ